MIRNIALFLTSRDVLVDVEAGTVVHYQ